MIKQRMRKYVLMFTLFFEQNALKCMFLGSFSPELGIDIFFLASLINSWQEYQSLKEIY